MQDKAKNNKMTAKWQKGNVQYSDLDKEQFQIIFDLQKNENNKITWEGFSELFDIFEEQPPDDLKELYHEKFFEAHEMDFDDFMALIFGNKMKEEQAYREMHKNK